MRGTRGHARVGVGAQEGGGRIGCASLWHEDVKGVKKGWVESVGLCSWSQAFGMWWRDERRVQNVNASIDCSTEIWGLGLYFFAPPKKG
jgi:hypothetical protein